MYREHPLGLTVRLHPAMAAKRIQRAIAAAGSVSAAATKLDCGLTTLKRWIAQLNKGGHTIEKVQVRRRVKEPAQALAPQS